MHAHTQKQTVDSDSYITGLERRPFGFTHLPKTDVKNKSERRSEWKETAHCRSSANSLHSKLTGEQTVAHDDIPMKKVTIAYKHLTHTDKFDIRGEEEVFSSLCLTCSTFFLCVCGFFAPLC
ncbi:hypothetical protein ILYODFUR_002014 [Ilyodon furcidens]|uniref:Uncharacterized protein n=1 Tax=Ilyodon furcidens TaxID=33524 RepID=A0ABV0UNK5_9TELE